MQRNTTLDLPTKSTAYGRLRASTDMHRVDDQTRELTEAQFYAFDDYREEHKALHKAHLATELDIFLRNRKRNKEY